MADVTNEYNALYVVSGDGERDPGFEVVKREHDFRVSLYQDNGNYCHFSLTMGEVKKIRDRLTAMMRKRLPAAVEAKKDD